MIEIDSKDFIVKVLLNANPDRKHEDVTKPQIATKEGANGKKGLFFQLSLLGKRDGPRDIIGKKLLFNVWNNGQRSAIFEHIAEVLSENEFTISKLDGGAILNANKIVFYGQLMTQKARDENGKLFSYKRVDSTGKELINPKTKKPNITDTVQLFIFDFEAKSGVSDLLFASEMARAYENRITIPKSTENPIIVDEEELENAAAEAEAAETARLETAAKKTK